MARSMPVFLVGPRGSGKSWVARLLAERTGFTCVDADVILQQRAGMSIRDIFEKEGEVGFRQRERELLEQLALTRSAVIATGGGVVLLEANRDVLKASGRVVWLTADVATLWQRICADPTTAEHRPNLTTGGREEVAEIVAAREPLYRAVAGHVVDTTNRSLQEVVDDIHEWLGRP